MKYTTRRDRGRKMGWLKRWDIWGVVVGVVGIAIAAYTFFATDKIGRISYSFDTQKVFDPGILSGFTLVDSDKESVKQAVYATDFVFWNSGDLSLSENSDRVREPIKISVDGTIHYFILNKFNVVPADNYRLVISEDKKSLSISWRYFDPPQGIRLTLIHSSSEVTRPAISGRFFETSLIEQAQFPPDKNKAIERLDKFVTVTFVVLGAIVIGMTTWRWRRLRKSGKTLVPVDYLFPLMVLCMVGIQLALFTGYFSRIPPV